MNQVITTLSNKIGLLKGLDRLDQTKPYYQAKFEYYLVHLLAYLWNKNLAKLTIPQKEYVINTVMKPSIGSIVATCRELDIDKEIFNNSKTKKLYKVINDYPRLRNERIGHGYSFEDSTGRFVEMFDQLFSAIDEISESYLTHDHELIKVVKLKGGIYTGIRFSLDSQVGIWSCPIEVEDFKVNSLYSYSEKYGYHRLTPFIVCDDSEFYAFSSVNEKLTGQVKYNRLLKTGTLYEEHEELASFTTMSDSLKKRTGNGTIITQFDRNFKKYIEVGLSKSILTFLLKSKSSVFATIWGHGGVGKTAAVQDVCDTLCDQERKKFDYIIFLSAKDRYYNYYKGQVQKVDTAITGLNDVLQITNQVLFSMEGSIDQDKIIDFDGKMLLVIDDFETFSKIEKSNIISFIKKLNINYHKVLITTRSVTLVTGEEISANELNEKLTLEFLIKALEIEVPSFPLNAQRKSLNKYSESIWRVTNGRPLFILQFAVLLGQKGTVTSVINTDIKNSESAKNFLYDRIYDYLSPDGKGLFIAISLVANKDDLTGPTDVLRFLLSMENDTDKFELVFTELIKLKIIFKESDEVFSIYSKDVLKIMIEHYESKGADINPDISTRFSTISGSKELDINLKLLETADSKRFTSSEGEVENLYRRIIKREQAPKLVKLKALLNFTDYLASVKNDLNKAIRVLKNHRTKFKDDYAFILSYSKYHWFEGSVKNRYESTKTIRTFLNTRPKLPETHYYLLISKLMVYETTLVVSEREELRILSKFNEVSDAEYSERKREQSRRYHDLYSYPGSKLKHFIQDKKVMNLPSKLRMSILEGLASYIEIMIRTRKIDEAKLLAVKIIEDTPTDYHPAFQVKLQTIDRIENPDSYDRYGNPKPESDLGILLKKALGRDK